ncbi:MAG: hypothetical protein FWE79_02150, partial [Firmicutes bacterium]|nr:hypothetical protein [Bacillota bacterium]
LYWNYEEYKRSPWWDYIRTKAYVKASAVLDCIPDCQNRLKVKLDANKKPILKDGSRLFVRCRNDMTIRGPFIGHHLNYFTIGCERVRFGIKSMLAKIVGMKDDLIAVCNECHGRGIHHMEMHKEILVPLFARQSTTTNSSPTA